MSGSITCGGGENIPGIPGANALRNFTQEAHEASIISLVYGHDYELIYTHIEIAYVDTVHEQSYMDQYMMIYLCILGEWYAYQ